jgi:CubicO group peptidase (beta-lactamase class C family)
MSSEETGPAGALAMPPAARAWREVPADSAAMDPALVAAAIRCAGDRLSGGRAAGQLVVLRRGRVVVDRAFGALPDSLFLLHSTSKPYVALLVHLLVERGLLSLDEPIANHWPEFARHGKQTITARHVLTHRAGVPNDSPPGQLRAAPDWEASVRRMEALVPLHPPGRVAEYHALTFGWILGELVGRVAGMPVESFLSRELLRPLRLGDTYLGLPEDQLRRAVWLVPSGGRAELVDALAGNRRRHRRSVSPASTISSTARDVALLLEMLRLGGELDGRRLLSRETVWEARRAVTGEPEEDRSLGRRVRWAHGFHLGGATGPDDVAAAMGTLSSTEAFGHNGGSCCTAWTDPGRELVFTYLTSLLLRSPQGSAHHGLVADCILRACD